LTLAFLDEEELAPPPGGTRPPSRRGPDRQRQLLLRRAIGIGIVVLVLILIVLGIKGCLNARKTRSFENYVSDLNAITAQTSQLSGEFFGKLSDPGTLSALQFKAEIAADRGTAETLATRVNDLSTPGELSNAQNELELAYELRAKAMTGISDQMSTALGNPGPERNKAIASISDFMQYFLASDVLYTQAQAQIDTELSNQGINEKAPASVFMTDPTRWLDPLQVSTALSAISSGNATTRGTHGLSIVQTTVKPGDVLLSTDTPATISGNGAAEIDVQVSNGGSVTEKGVGVSFSLTGGPQTITGTATIGSIAAGAIQTAPLPVHPSPQKNTPLTLEVTANPVPGEQITTNNRFTYQLTFR
jgi:outer membrane lipoprotein-sorting protein